MARKRYYRRKNSLLGTGILWLLIGSFAIAIIPYVIALGVVIIGIAFIGRCVYLLIKKVIYEHQTGEKMNIVLFPRKANEQNEVRKEQQEQEKAQQVKLETQLPAYKRTLEYIETLCEVAYKSQDSEALQTVAIYEEKMFEIESLAKQWMDINENPMKYADAQEKQRFISEQLTDINLEIREQIHKITDEQFKDTLQDVAVLKNSATISHQETI